MEKDVGVLLGTTNQEIFEEQVALWPGVSVFQKYAHDCKCGDPECFMRCLRKFAAYFPTRDEFVDFVNSIENVQTEKEMIILMTAEWARQLAAEKKAKLASQTVH